MRWRTLQLGYDNKPETPNDLKQKHTAEHAAYTVTKKEIRRTEICQSESFQFFFTFFISCNQSIVLSLGTSCIIPEKKSITTTIYAINHHGIIFSI